MTQKTLIFFFLPLLAVFFTGCGSEPDMANYRPQMYHGAADPLFDTPVVRADSSPIHSDRYGYRSGTRDERGHRPGPKNFRTVIIDAGHGGRDPGATVAGITEKSLALDVAKRLKRELSGKFRVVLVRKGDYFVELDDRVRYTKRYNNAILVSIHLNHGTSRYLRGPESYYFRVDSYSLAKRLQKNLATVSPRTSSRGLVRRRLRLTRNPEIPSVLVELGYLSNGTDRALLQQSSYRQKLAAAMANAIENQNRYGDQGMGALPPPLDRPLSRPTDRTEL